MISARKSAWFERLFAVYNRHLIRRRFEGLRVAGLEHLRRRAGDAPLILYANHSSWWDGLVAFEVGRACRLDQFVMMEERQLRQYALFRGLGAFSVARGNPREALRSVEYAAVLLRGSARSLWIFPQGVTLPNDSRPLTLEGGAAHIIRRAGAVYAAPVAMRYEFLGAFRPDAFARVGPLERFDARGELDVRLTTRHMAGRLTETLDELRRDVLDARLEDYEEVVAPDRRAREGRPERG